MFKMFSNKFLLILLGIMTVIVLTVKIYQNNKGENTFLSDLVATDSSKIDKIVFSNNNNSEVTLEKKNKEWMVIWNNTEYKPDIQKIEEVLQVIQNLKPSRMVSVTEDKWKEYDVTDSSGIKLSIYKGNKQMHLSLEDLIIRPMRPTTTLMEEEIKDR